MNKEATDCPKCGGSNTRRVDQDTKYIELHGLACDDCMILMFDGCEHLANLKAGDTLYGYCQGWFGRDSYEDKRIEAIGDDWIVCRDTNGTIHMATVNPEFARDIQDLLNKPENRKPMKE